ncbi:MAG: hypothetical protein ABIW79_00905, partial [Gemmatimonas sp.]
MPDKQSNISHNLNQAIFGLNTDNIISQIKQGTLTYALNAQIDSFDGNQITYQNEQSTVLCSEFKTAFRIVGYKSIVEQNRTIVFLTNPSNGDNEIGEINNLITCNVNEPTNLNKINNKNYVNNGYNNIDPNCNCQDSPEIISFNDLYKNLNPSNKTHNSCCTYKTLISGKCLGFSTANPIKKIVYRIVDINDDGKCGTEIYWAQSGAYRRYLNLDNLPFKTKLDGCDRISTGEIDCGLLEVQAPLEIPCITPLVVNDGGSLIAGTYEFAIGYANNKAETYTSYYSVTNPIGVFEKV